MPAASTILLVDDEDSVQKLLTFPLERDGFRVVQARDGEQALRLFGDERIDLVVLDLMLPKVDGLEVCKRLRAGSDVPIIMLTARGEELDKVLGLELGADDYITKPFSIREFRSRVRALLRRASLARDSGPREGEVIEVGQLRIDPARRTVAKLNDLARAAPKLVREYEHHRHDPDFLSNADASTNARVLLLSVLTQSPPTVTVQDSSRPGQSGGAFTDDPVALHSAKTS